MCNGVTILPEMATYDFEEDQMALIRPFQEPAPMSEVSVVTHRNYEKFRFIEALRTEIQAALPARLRPADASLGGRNDFLRGLRRLFPLSMTSSPTALARTAAQFRYDGRTPFSITEAPTLTEPFYTSEDDRARQLDELTGRMDQAQNRMHAHGRYGLLVLFQALDAAGKDSTIRHVFKGINPSRFQVSSFKKPGDEDLAHDFLWRSWRELPERGTIGIFNRSYYEEVLALQVHPDRLAEHYLPEAATANLAQLWKERYRDLAYFEDYLGRNGFPVIKFFLNVSKVEQGKRLISRLSDPEKQWKFSANDLEERQHWDAYASVYEAAINATATRHAPWYVIPSDDRRNQQLIIARIMTHLLEKLPTQFPAVEAAEAKKLIREIEKQDQ